jgi:hypothetical protein
LKTRDVQRCAGVQVLVLDADMRTLAVDVIGEPPLTGTTGDWVRCQSVVDVPATAIQVQFAAALWGPGELDMDGFELAVVPEAVPVTGDGAWMGFSPWVGRYAAEPDASRDAVRNGHATVCLHNIGDAGDKRPFGAFMRRLIGADLEPYRGKRIRISATLKSDGVVGNAGLFAASSRMGTTLVDRRRPPQGRPDTRLRSAGRATSHTSPSPPTPTPSSWASSSTAPARCGSTDLPAHGGSGAGDGEEEVNDERRGRAVTHHSSITTHHHGTSTIFPCEFPSSTSASAFAASASGSRSSMIGRSVPFSSPARIAA